MISGDGQKLSCLASGCYLLVNVDVGAVYIFTPGGECARTYHRGILRCAWNTVGCPMSTVFIATCLLSRQSQRFEPFTLEHLAVIRVNNSPQ